MNQANVLRKRGGGGWGGVGWGGRLYSDSKFLARRSGNRGSNKTSTCKSRTRDIITHPMQNMAMRPCMLNKGACPSELFYLGWRQFGEQAVRQEYPLHQHVTKYVSVAQH